MRLSPVLPRVLLLIVATPAAAQTAETGNFAYCQVEDTGAHHIWVSQVFPVPPGTDFLGTTLASEFHAYVGTLGGAGNKTCTVAASRAAAQETRDKIEAIMRKRVFGISVYKWHDVAWTPNPALVPETPVAAPKFVYCRTVDTDARKLVATQVFVATLPPPTDAARYQVLDRLAAEFRRSVGALGLNGSDGMCLAHDSQAEADKDREDFRKAFTFSGVKKIDLTWTPGPAPAPDPVSPPLAPPQVAPTPLPAVITPAANQADDVEADFWRRIAASRNPEDFEDYLANFPQGRHAPVARLEAKRLRRDRTSPSPTATATATATAKGAPAAAPATTPAATPGGPAPEPDPAFPIAPEIRQQLATHAFFRVPEGGGQSVRLTGKRVVNQNVPVASSTGMTRVAGSNMCRMDQQQTIGAGTPMNVSAQGLTWAGLLSLSLSAQLGAQSGNNETIVRVVAIDKLVGQPWPLFSGNAFSFAFTFDNGVKGSQAMRFVQRWSCRVGATGPASAVVPGLPGDQTELACHLAFDNPVMPEQNSLFRWFSAVGCFVQDPSR